MEEAGAMVQEGEGEAWRHPTGGCKKRGRSLTRSGEKRVTLGLEHDRQWESEKGGEESILRCHPQ